MRGFQSALNVEITGFMQNKLICRTAHIRLPGTAVFKLVLYYDAERSTLLLMIPITLV